MFYTLYSMILAWYEYISEYSLYLCSWKQNKTLKIRA